MKHIDQSEITKAEVLDQLKALADRKGLTLDQLYSRVCSGVYRGSILETKVRALRFTLGD